MKPCAVKLSFCLLVPGIFSTAPSNAAEKRIELTATEDTAISIVEGHSLAKVTFHPNRTGDSVVKDEGGCGSSGVETAFLKSLEISVNDRRVFVPRSAYADLVNLREATVRNDGGAFILTLSGGDSADSYYAQIFFDGNGISRKKVFSALVPDKPTEETRYWLRVLKDE